MKKTLSLILLVLLGITSAEAYDFSAVAPSGQTLYYFITSINTVSVVPQNSYSWTTPPTGALTIPSTVTNAGTTYTVTSITGWAFFGCRDLTSVTIPNSVTTIGEAAFMSCMGLTTVSLPDSITSIEDDVFAYCSSLTSITIPNSVTSIGEGTFDGCSSLTTVTIPNSVTSIGIRAFFFCDSLTTVTLPNSVTSIGDEAFEGCSSLTSITIPNSITAIGNGVFQYCSSLTSITIPNSVTSIGAEAFEGCSSLTSITIPNSVTSIGDRVLTFCDNLTTVSLPNSITSIGNLACAFCLNLTSITIPSSVTSIGNGAFAYCLALTQIISHPYTAPSLGSSVFDSVRANIPVYIPCGRSASYRSAWTNFNNFVESLLPFDISVVSSDETQGSVTILQRPSCSDSHAVVLAIPARGYFFDGWSNGATQNPYTFTVTSDTLISAIFAEEHGDTVYVHDTVTLYDTITVTEYVHDTITVHDTVGGAMNYYTITLTSDDTQRGMVAGNGEFPEGTEVEIAAVPIEGNVFVQWSDGNTSQIRTVTTDADITLFATFEPRGTEGINDVMGAAYAVSTERGAIVVKDAVGEGIRVFDVAGRLRYQGRVETELWRLGVSNSGTYFVQIADSPAQKVVVIE